MKILPSLCLAFLTLQNIWAANIKSMDVIETSATEGRLIIKFDGDLKDNPKLLVKDKSIYMTIPDSKVFPKIERKASLNGQFDTALSATQGADELVNVKANFPFSFKGKESQLNVMLKDSAIEVIFPKTSLPKIVKKATSEKDLNVNVAQHLDEAYLAKIESESNAKNTDSVKTETTELKEDGVSLTQAAGAKSSSLDSLNDQNESLAKQDLKTEEPKSEFSVVGYIGKFVAFLSLLLLVFYGVLQMFKKGIIKKGNLGFLNSTKLVEVLSTTHLAPKRSLMMVRAHKQVFLVASSETGIQYLSEIKDVAGLLRQGEKEIAGTNFDSEYSEAETEEKTFRMKEDVTEADKSQYGSLDDLLDEVEEPIVVKPTTNNRPNAKLAKNAYGGSRSTTEKENQEATRALVKSVEKELDKDQVRLSDQIKTRLKGLKQLQ